MLIWLKFTVAALLRITVWAEDLEKEYIRIRAVPFAWTKNGSATIQFRLLVEVLLKKINQDIHGNSEMS